MPAGRVGRHDVHIEAGAFRNRAYADDLLRRSRANGYTITLVEGPFIRVWVWPPKSGEAVERLAANLRLNGYEAVLSPAG